MADTELSIWTVYRPPGGATEPYVALRWVAGDGRYGPTRDVLQAATLEVLRAALLARQPGLYPLARQPGDDPSIIETWF